MSDAYATDLMTKLATVPALATTAGMTAGGKDPDPAMQNSVLPAAWVLFGSDRPKDGETGMVPKSQSLLITYVVAVYVPYTSQSDLINTQFPLLRAARIAIHATNSPNGNRWKYEGQSLVQVNADRLIYEQRYSVLASL